MNRWIAIFALLIAGWPAPSALAVKIADITRLDGERANTVVGVGLVFGLKGTGDGGSYLPTMRAFAELLKKMENPVALPDLSNASNVAMVMVSVNLPDGGIRNGDQLDVKVMTMGSATSLRGGNLFLAPLVGPTPQAGVLGLARGDIDLDDPVVPTRGIIRKGAMMEVDLPVEVISNGTITLVLQDSSAHRVTASTVAKIVNDAEGNGQRIAVAIDGKDVIVQIPENERGRPNDFISRILQLPVRMLPTEARVVVNRKTGTIIITGDVEISPCVISQKGLTIATVTPPPVPSARNPVVTERRALGLDTTREGGARLQDLVDALDAIKVPTDDRISIIEELEKSGYLHAKLIVE
jgi:flagellar P-ring protein FlgI